MIQLCTFKVIFLILIFSSFGIGSSELGCDGYWRKGYDSMCYLFNTNKEDWQSAETYCQRQGGHLVSIHSKAKNQYLKRALSQQSPSDYWWIGIGNGSLKTWSDRTSIDYTNWAPRSVARANNMCGVLIDIPGPRQGEWAMVDCGTATSFVCQKKMVQVKHCPLIGFVDVSNTEVDPECGNYFKPTLVLENRDLTKHTLKYPGYTKSLDQLKATWTTAQWLKFIRRRTIFIIHGFMDTGDERWIQRMKRQLLLVEDCNVIVVHWGLGASSPFYVWSASNTRVVGAIGALFVDHLVNLGASQDMMWCIGHSLGAHACGFMGKLSFNTLGRITGLDPAKPDFDGYPIIYHINKMCATQVDAIHTGGNKNDSAVISYGTLMPVGDADFYPNGGERQPGCTWTEDLEGCSHKRSHDLFTETITSKNCLAGQLNNVTHERIVSNMGYQWDGKVGMFYSVTGKTSPYCMGTSGVCFSDPTVKHPHINPNCTRK